MVSRGVPVDVRARTTLPATVDSPAAARAFTRAAVAGVPVRIDDLTLVVSELVTNALVHGTGDITLHVTGIDDGVRVEVGDDDPPPASLPVGNAPAAESGRGLLLVSRVATAWGVRPDGGGKVVWADVAR